MSTVAIILAADVGQDFVSPKYLTPLRDGSMIATTLVGSGQWNVRDRVVVLGPDAEQIAETISDQDITVVIDPEWNEGASSPIRAALDLVTRDRSVTRCVIARADQPTAQAAIVNEVISVAETSEADIVLPKYRYARGWPVVIGPAVWEYLLGQEGDLDVLKTIELHAGVIEEVWFDQIAPVILDTTEAVVNELG